MTIMAVTNIQAALAEVQNSKKNRSWWGILKKSASQWIDADADDLGRGDRVLRGVGAAAPCWSWR